MPVTEVLFRPLPWALFKFPPDNDPQALPVPQPQDGLFRPGSIDPKLYNDMLSVYWPVTIAVVYATTVSFMNQVNKSRNNKPWAISRTSLFTIFVLAHNIFLTVYSAWTFFGMLGGMRRSFSGILDNYSEYGIAPVIDGLCKLKGPRGIGSAASWDPYYGQWTVKDQAVKLLNGNPDPTDVGRIWNEGLAYYGWLFYLSKFYEVLDTVIILAKGKRSSLLQTYHHAGAMMCMWAGIRYMSPPIWMFVQFNSGIHALMYFYYTLAALGVKVPNRIKRSLTTLQISQFVIGANYAFAHLLIAYKVPANTPYIFSHGVTSAVSSAATSIASAVPTELAGWGPWLKKAVLRAVGDEGLAENVRGPSGGRFGIDALKAQISDTDRQEIRYRMEYPTVHCLDTSGEAFAIWLNVLYLLPLTYLFGRFFVTSYLKRASAEKQTPALHQRMVRSGSDAAKGVDREIRQAMGDKQGYNSPIDDEFAIELDEEIERAKDGIKSAAAAVKEEGAWLSSRVQEKAQPVVNGAAEKAKQVKKEIKEESKPILDEAQSKATEVKEQVQTQAPKIANDAQVKVQKVASQVKEEAPKVVAQVRQEAPKVVAQVKEEAPKVIESAKQSAKGVAEQAKEQAPQVAEVAQKKTQEVADEVKKEAPKAVEATQAKTQEVKEHVQKKAESAASKVKETADATADKAQQGASQVQEKTPKSVQNAQTDGSSETSVVKSGESFADAVKKDPEETTTTTTTTTHYSEGPSSTLEESVVEVTRDEAQAYEVNPDENLSLREVIAEKTEGQQPAEGSSDSTSLFG